MGRRSILVLFAHPALQKSRVQRRLIQEPLTTEGVTLHDLYESYPHFDIDVQREQRLLEEHDVIIMQHPLYWYSTPAILKEWQDLVLEHGWAYGSQGDALHGKTMMNVVSSGGGEKAYCHEGSNRFTIRELLAPLQQTARLCGMRYLAPFVVFGTHAMPTAQIDANAEDYREMLEAIRDDRIDLDLAERIPRINADLDSLITSGGEG